MRLKRNATVFAALLLTAPAAFPPAALTASAEGVEALPAPGPGTAPVLFNGRELFHVGTVGPAEAESRAEELVKRLERVAASPRVRTDLLRLEDDEELGVTLILTRDQMVHAVWEQEAELLGRGRLEIAGEQMGLIGEAIEEYRHDYSPKAIAKGAVFAALTTAAFLMSLFLLRWLRRRGEGALERRLQGRMVAKMLRGEAVIVFVRGIMRLVRLALALWLILLYVNLILGFFPWTLNLAVRLFDLILGPLEVFGIAFAEHIPDFFALAIIIIITRLILRAIRYVFKEIGRGYLIIPGFYADWAGPTYQIIRILIVALAVVAAFPYIPGSGSPAFKGISVFIGVLFSLGSTSAVANVIAGLILTYMRPFVAGDRVKLGETVGDVIERRLLSTRLRTTKNEQVVVPNMSVLGGHIVNFSELARGEGLILHTAVTIGYDTPWRRVHELLLAAAEETADVLKVPPPFVLQTALEDFYVRYELNAATARPDRMPSIYSELHQNIQDQFAEGGVEIMSPHYRASRDGGESAIPGRAQ